MLRALFSLLPHLCAVNALVVRLRVLVVGKVPKPTAIISKLQDSGLCLMRPS